MNKKKRGRKLEPKEGLGYFAVNHLKLFTGFASFGSRSEDTRTQWSLGLLTYFSHIVIQDLKMTFGPDHQLISFRAGPAT